jgi:flagella basal body P-ring formation protein FlgA
MRSTLTLALGAALFALAATPALAATDAAPATQPEAAPNATLRSAARVTAAQITLGDIFDNAGAHAGDVVATAPPAGTSLLFEAAWLSATAHHYGLAWQPPSSETSIRVQRAARTVDNAELADRIAQQLGVVPAKTQISFDTQYRIEVPIGDQPGYGLEHVELNQATNRLTAELRIPAGDLAAAPIRVSGRLIAMIDVPVLAHPMAPGDKVVAGDVTWTSIASASMPAGDIMDPQDMVGRTPRRPLPAGQPLRPTDLQVPILIKRNDPVLIVLERPGLYLTAEGKAMDEGGRDAVIRVVNVQSNRTIDAVVLESGKVAVRTPSVQQALAR